MFKLLGADQKEYGPVSADQIRQWIAQGRANARTKLQAAGSIEWKALAEFSEFTDALQNTASPGEPTSPPGGAQPTAAPSNASGLGITSLVLGCLGLLTCGITALVGLIVGIIALVRIKKSEGRLGGQPMALAGTVVSAVFLLIGPIPAAMLLPALAKAKAKAQAIQCMNNVKQLNLGVMMYVTDNRETFPSGTNWCDLLTPYVNNTNTFLCKLGKPGERSHYALNANLAGHEMKDIQSPATLVLIFETDGGWNAIGGREQLATQPRHSGAYGIGFADGHAEMVRPSRLDKLRWEP